MCLNELQPQLQPGNPNAGDQEGVKSSFPQVRRHVSMVGPVGLEPTTYGLKVCSALC